MRRCLDNIAIDGTIVIGEGERDKAPMLYIGEKLGSTKDQAGALTVGIGEELSLLVLSPNYRSAVGFLAILLVLTIRPRGILGQRAY